jgi:hypothetical protein
LFVCVNVAVKGWPMMAVLGGGATGLMTQSGLVMLN